MSSRLPPSKRPRRPREETRLIVVANPIPNRRQSAHDQLLACYSSLTSEERPGGTRSSSSVLNVQSKDVIVAEDDIPVVKMTTIWRKLSEGGRNNANAKTAEEEVPGNQHELDQEKKASTNKASEVCHIDDNEEQSTPSVRENFSSRQQPLLDRTHAHWKLTFPLLWDRSEICIGPLTYPVLPPLQSSATYAVHVLFLPRPHTGQPPTPFLKKFKDVWDIRKFHIKKIYGT